MRASHALPWSAFFPVLNLLFSLIGTKCQRQIHKNHPSPFNPLSTQPCKPLPPPPVSPTLPPLHPTSSDVIFERWGPQACGFTSAAESTLKTVISGSGLRAARCEAPGAVPTKPPRRRRHLGHNQNPVFKMVDPEPYLKKNKRADIHSFLWLGVSLANLHLPGC